MRKALLPSAVLSLAIPIRAVAAGGEAGRGPHVPETPFPGGGETLASVGPPATTEAQRAP